MQWLHSVVSSQSTSQLSWPLQRVESAFVNRCLHSKLFILTAYTFVPFIHYPNRLLHYRLQKYWSSSPLPGEIVRLSQVWHTETNIHIHTYRQFIAWHIHWILWNHAPVSPTWNLFQCFCCIKLLQPYSKWMDSATAKRQIDLRFSCNTVSKTIPVCQWTTLFAFVSITQTSTRKHLLQKGSYNVERLGVTLVVAWESKSILSALNSHLDITYMKHKWMQNLQAEWIGLF